MHTFKSPRPSRRSVRSTKERTVGSKWTKTEAADEAAAEAATTAARVRCLMRCARTVAKPRRSRSNRTRQGLSTAEIVSQSAGRDGSKSITAAFEPYSVRAPNPPCGWRGARFSLSHPRVRESSGQGPQPERPARPEWIRVERVGLDTRGRSFKPCSESPWIAPSSRLRAPRRFG